MEKLLVSFSGGKTSGYMTKRIKDQLRDKYEVVVVFANTGEENEKTLKFVNNCDKYFGFETVWVEAVVHHGERVANSHKVVTFDSASRAGEPFEQTIVKYGIANPSWPLCTEKLKRHPIESYVRSIGWDDYKTAIGIRVDEQRRVNEKQAEKRQIVYPLIDWFPADKQDVNDWWEGQAFNLELKEHQGNCKWCWKKSFKKHAMIMAESPDFFDFPERMEKKYGYVGAEFSKETEVPYQPRVFFRGNISTVLLREMCKQTNDFAAAQISLNLDGGCAESCELFETSDPVRTEP